MRIAIFDDEPALRRLIQTVLESEGHTVVVFSRPVDLRGAEVPDFFLIDRGMGDLDGIELAARLCDQAFAAIPKIAMAASLLWLEAASQSLLFQGMLQKPFDMPELVQCVELVVMLGSSI